MAAAAAALLRREAVRLSGEAVRHSGAWARAPPRGASAPISTGLSSLDAPLGKDELRALLLSASDPLTPSSRADFLSRIEGELGIQEEQGPTSVGLVLRHPSRDAPLARLTLEDGGLLHGCDVHRSLPVRAAAPLVERALGILRGAALPRADVLVGLPGLSEWVVEAKRWDCDAVSGEESREAVKAVALGRPRPGHSVLGEGTFRAARQAWAELARRYVRECEEAHAVGSEGQRERLWEEVELYTSLGASLEGPLHLADMSEERIRASGGAMLHLVLPVL